MFFQLLKVLLGDRPERSFVRKEMRVVPFGAVLPPLR